MGIKASTASVMHRIRGCTCATLATLAATGVILCHLTLQPPPAAAHDADLPIAAGKLSLRTNHGLDKQRFKFTTGRQLAIGLAHDPSQTSTWLLVRGYGDDGGTSGRIELDAARWEPLGRPTAPRGYRYMDPAGSRGGVRKIMLRPGRLIIDARGSGWPWQPGGPQSSVWVHFGVADESYCASLGGTIQRNEAGAFQAKGALPPAQCPQAVCGNAEQELGEECDDGNLVEDDGCTSLCAPGECVGQSYDSTFAAIEDLVFDRHGCTAPLCHGSSPGAGGLDLSPGVAYDNLLDVASTGSAYDLVEPGAPNSSSLYLKLLLAADPAATDIPGAGMPSGLPPIDDDLLETVRRWILSAAPQTGTVSGTETLLDGCFPDPQPISIAPLEPPDPADGFQLEMPVTDLPAQTEIEVCFATYYDMSDSVPPQYKDPTGQYFYSRSDITRQDPHSHHLVAMHSAVPETEVDHPSFGDWTCIGGDQNGALCNPIDTGSCGEEGSCRSRVGRNIACIGYGPPGGPVAGNPTNGLGGAGNGQSMTDLPPGFYRKVPLKGFTYWNAHAFNLTDEDHGLKAYLNLLYTDELENEVTPFTDSHAIFIAYGQPPYTIDSYCSTRTFEPGTRLLELSSHTHERGEVFWVTDPQGNEIYRSFVYNDPVVKLYDPPLEFDSPIEAERRITYCAIYNNGVAPDGTPDPSTVRKRSVTPSNAGLCNPVACTDGRVGEPCGGIDSHADCDSVPGAGDGVCDACAITRGVSTQDEMFVLTGRTYQNGLP